MSIQTALFPIAPLSQNIWNSGQRYGEKLTYLFILYMLFVQFCRFHYKKRFPLTSG